MNNTQKFELLLEEPWIWEGLEPPEDPLGELTELENSLRLFCYECNHKVALKIGEERKELFLDPDIILALNELPEQMRELSLGKKVEIDFPESWLILKFIPNGDRLNCILHKFGSSSITKEFKVDKAQVLEMFEGFLEELMQMAIANGYISYAQKGEFLRGWNLMPETTALDVASYLTNVCKKLGKTIDPMKLQKLLYYAQAWYLAIYDKPLFEEPIEAWRRGPVQPQVYPKFPDQINSHVKLPRNIEQHLKSVIEVYGDYDAPTLRDMTHEESPWQQARGDLPKDEPSSAVISRESMRVYFKNLLDKPEYSIFKTALNFNSKTTNVLRSIPVVTPDTETIYVTQVMGHNLCIAVEDAEKVRDRIVAALKEGKKAIVSFKDGEDFTSAYLGEAIGRLYSIFPEPLVEKFVSFVDMDPFDNELLEYTLEEVKEYLKNPERWDAAALATFGEDYFDEPYLSN